MPSIVEEKEGPLSSISPIIVSFLSEVTQELLKFIEIEILVGKDFSHVRSEFSKACFGISTIIYHSW